MKQYNSRTNKTYCSSFYIHIVHLQSFHCNTKASSQHQLTVLTFPMVGLPALFRQVCSISTNKRTHSCFCAKAYTKACVLPIARGDTRQGWFWPNHSVSVHKSRSLLSFNPYKCAHTNNKKNGQHDSTYNAQSPTKIKACFIRVKFNILSKSLLWVF